MKRLFAVIIAVSMLLQTGCASKEERAAEAKTLTRGTWSDTVFISRFAGLTFTAPANWTIQSDGDLAALMGMASEEVAGRGAEVSAKMLELTTIYDMMAMDPATNENVILMYENLAMHLGGTLLEADKYLSAVKEQLEEYDMGFSFTGVTDSALGGQSYKSFEGTNAEFGIKQVYYAKKINDFMLVIIITVIDGSDDALNRITSSFAAL